MIIEAERLILRPFRESDAANVPEYENTMQHAVLKKNGDKKRRSHEG